MDANIDSPHGDQVDRTAEATVTRAAAAMIQIVIGLLDSSVVGLGGP
jgi:hypothetical protein